MKAHIQTEGLDHSYAQVHFNNGHAPSILRSGSMGVENVNALIKSTRFGRSKAGLRTLYIRCTQIFLVSNLQKIAYWDAKLSEVTYFYNIPLYYIIFYDIALYFIILYYILLYFIMFYYVCLYLIICYYILLYLIIFYYILLYFIILYYISLYFSNMVNYGVKSCKFEII